MKKPPPLDSHFLLRKVHSLLGVIPVGLFLCFHLFMNSKAVMEGHESLGETFTFAQVVKSIESLHPSRAFLNAVEILFIFLPLLLHGIYGLVIWWKGKNNVLKPGYGFFRNWMYTLQRWTGILVFLFLIAHVYRMRLAGHGSDLAWAPDEVFKVLHDYLQNGFGLALYIVGVLASAFHFANGLWLVGITWGITIGPRSQKISTAFAVLVFLVLVFLGGVALYGFAALPPATHVAGAMGG